MEPICAVGMWWKQRHHINSNNSHQWILWMQREFPQKYKLILIIYTKQKFVKKCKLLSCVNSPKIMIHLDQGTWSLFILLMAFLQISTKSLPKPMLWNNSSNPPEIQVFQIKILFEFIAQMVPTISVPKKVEVSWELTEEWARGCVRSLSVNPYWQPAISWLFHVDCVLKKKGVTSQIRYMQKSIYN